MNTSGAHPQNFRAEVSRASDVVRSVPDHDELLRQEFDPEMIIDSLRGQGRQMAPIERFMTEGSRQSKELSQACGLNFQMRGRLDVAGQECRLVSRMIVRGL